MNNNLESMFSWIVNVGFSNETAEKLKEKILEPHRFYHGSFHIGYLWKLWKSRLSTMDEAYKIKLGLLIAFHDSVYNIGDPDNERKSADFFSDCIQRDCPGIDDEVLNTVNQAIPFTSPKKYNEIEYNSLAYRFVVDYDLNHFVDPMVDLDLVNRLLFKEYQKYSFKEYLKGTEELLNSIPFRNIKKESQRAIDWLKNPNRKLSIGVYAGSFDPFHVGHASILRQAESFFDKVIILVGCNSNKKQSPAGTRAAKVSCILPNHEIVYWNGLTTDYIDNLEKEHGSEVTLVRGLRTDTDFAKEEINQRWMEALKPDLKIIYISCENEYRHVSSSALRGLDESLFFSCNERIDDRLKKYIIDTKNHYILTKKIISKKFNVEI